MERCEVLTWATPVSRRPAAERIAEDAVDLFMALAVAARGALFACARGGRLSLEASRSLDQGALDLAHDEWAQASEALRTGTPAYRQRDERAFLLLPCFDAGVVVGLLYVELGSGSRRIPAQHLTTFGGILGRALQERAGVVTRGVDGGADAAGLPDAERENLVLLLERNEWNVSRVARALGVTRMTVYNRLRRYSVERQRVRKTRARKAG